MAHSVPTLRFKAKSCYVRDDTSLRACHERKRGWGRRRGRGADTKSTDPHLTDGGHVKHEKLQGKRKDIQAHERKRKWKENNRKNEWHKKQETKGRGRERTRCWLLFQSFRRGLHQKVMTGCICAYCQIWKLKKSKRKIKGTARKTKGTCNATWKGEWTNHKNKNIV